MPKKCGFPAMIIFFFQSYRTVQASGSVTMESYHLWRSIHICLFVYFFVCSRVGSWCRLLGLLSLHSVRSDFLRSTHKFALSSSCFWHLLSKRQKHEDDFCKFCVFLRKSQTNSRAPYVLYFTYWFWEGHKVLQNFHLNFVCM